MAHTISIREDGTAEMAYVGEKPWHGLGQELQQNATIEEWQKAAGMDWEIKRTPLLYKADNDVMFNIDDQNILYRSDTKTHLSVVSNKYQIVQPVDMLEFFRDITQAAGFQMETAGTLFGGKRFWALAAIGESACVVGDDQIDGYLLLSTSCDGTLATSARFTTTRVVCNNTLSMALSTKAKREVSVRHRAVFDASAVKDQLGIAKDSFKDFLVATRKLAQDTITTKQAEKFVANLFTTDTYTVADVIDKSRAYTQIMDLYNGQGKGSSLPGVKDTRWGAVNAVSEYVDHHIHGKTMSHTVANAWFGRGDELKTKALEMAIAL